MTREPLSELRPESAHKWDALDGALDLTLEAQAWHRRDRLWDAAWDALAHRNYAEFDRLIAEFRQPTNGSGASAEQAAPNDK